MKDDPPMIVESMKAGEKPRYSARLSAEVRACVVAQISPSTSFRPSPQSSKARAMPCAIRSMTLRPGPTWPRSDSAAPTIAAPPRFNWLRSEEHTSELQSLAYLVCRLLLENKTQITTSFAHLTGLSGAEPTRAAAARR